MYFFYVEQNGATFTSFSINPLLRKTSYGRKLNNYRNGKGFIGIENISAFSRIDIAAAEVGPSGVKDEDNSKLTVNIPSDETVGKCNTYVFSRYIIMFQY